jgi:hypothetical protein
MRRKSPAQAGLQEFYQLCPQKSYMRTSMAVGWVIQVQPPRNKGVQIWYAAIPDADEACRRVKDAAQTTEKMKVVRQLTETEIRRFQLRPDEARKRES